MEYSHSNEYGRRSFLKDGSQRSRWQACQIFNSTSDFHTFSLLDCPYFMIIDPWVLFPSQSVSALLIELGRWLDQELEGMPIRVTKFFLKRVSEPTTFPTIPWPRLAKNGKLSQTLIRKRTVARGSMHQPTHQINLQDYSWLWGIAEHRERKSIRIWRRGPVCRFGQYHFGL